MIKKQEKGKTVSHKDTKNIEKNINFLPRIYTDQH